MIITLKVFSLKNNINEITRCDTYYKSDAKSSPFVLLLHGFRAFSSWGFFPYFATKLAENNFIAGCLDFSLNTISDKEKQWFDMDRFRKNTVTQMITESKMLIEHLGDYEEIAKRWNGDVYIMGHSLGGALAIAVTDSINDNQKQIVKKIVTICSISDIDIYNIKQKEKWEELGYKEFFDSNTDQNIILDVDFLRDRLTYTAERSLASMISRLNVPTYFIHTEADVTVPPKSLDIISASFSDKLLLKTELIPKANHLLNCEHPFKGTNNALEQIVNNTISFYRTSSF